MDLFQAQRAIHQSKSLYLLQHPTSGITRKASRYLHTVSEDEYDTPSNKHYVNEVTLTGGRLFLETSSFDRY